jgi:hypothetical protein
MKKIKLIENLKSNKKISTSNTNHHLLDSMFGILKGKGKPFTRKEREEMWRERIYGDEHFKDFKEVILLK